ncbi:MAG: amidohydrolase family protein [Acidimicrobiia bacterium]
MIIDADSHVCEPPDTWTSRMSKKWGDLIPQVKYVEETGLDAWCVGDQVVNSLAFTVFYQEAHDSTPHRRPDDFPAMPASVSEVHPSSWDPTERVKVLDQFGISAAVLYPNLGLTNPDRYRTIPGATIEFQMDVIAAFNDFVLSWAQREPGRFIPLAVVPYWDVESAVKEVERCAELGHKGYVMSGTPQFHECPQLADRHWDPLWDAIDATGRPIGFHAGTTMNPKEYYTDPKARTIGGNKVSAVVDVVKSFLDNVNCCSTLLMSGVLNRYPDLKFSVVETGSGWVPYVLESLDVHYKRYRPWEDRPELSSDILPSELFRRQVFTNTWYENVRPDDLALLPIDNILFETDYPHPTCLFGDEISESLNVKLSALTDEQRDKIAYKNALRCFNLTEAEIGRPRARTAAS